MFSVNSIVLIIEGTWPERATVEKGCQPHSLMESVLSSGKGASRGTMNISTSCPLVAVKLSEKSWIAIPERYRSDIVAIPVSCPAIFPLHQVMTRNL